jgi:hypothetical protein
MCCVNIKDVSLPEKKRRHTFHPQVTFASKPYTYNASTSSELTWMYYAFVRPPIPP